MMVLSLACLWYAWQLRRCLTSLARMAIGLSATSDTELTLERKVFRKMKTITTVSLVITLAAWLRAGLLLQFASELVRSWSPAATVDAGEDAAFYLGTEALPALVLLGVLGRLGLAHRRLSVLTTWWCGCCCRHNTRSITSGSGPAVAFAADDDDLEGAPGRGCCSSCYRPPRAGGDGAALLSRDPDPTLRPVSIGRLLAGTTNLHSTPGGGPGLASLSATPPIMRTPAATGSWWATSGYRGSSGNGTGGGVAGLQGAPSGVGSGGNEAGAVSAAVARSPISVYEDVDSARFRGSGSEPAVGHHSRYLSDAIMATDIRYYSATSSVASGSISGREG